MGIADLQIPLITFGGGLNTSVNPQNIEDNETPDCANVYFDEKGSLTRRAGYTEITDSVLGLTPRGLYNFWTPTTSYLLMAPSSGILCRAGVTGSDFAGAWSDLSTATEPVPDGNGGAVDFCTFVDEGGGYYCVIAGDDSGTETPKYVTAAGVVTEENNNMGEWKFCRTFKNRVLFGNCTADGTLFTDTCSRNTICWTDDGTVNTFTLKSGTCNSTLNIPLEDGDEITSMEILGDRLIVYCNNSVWPINFTADDKTPFAVGSPLRKGTPTLKGVVSIGNGHVFYDNNGFFGFDGVALTPLSDKISPTVRTFEEAYRKNVKMASYEKLNQILAFVTPDGATTNTACYVYDTKNLAWTYYTGMVAPIAICNAHPIRGLEQVIVAIDDGANARFYKLDSGTTNNGTAISSYYYTKWLFFDQPDVEKRHRFLKFSVERETTSSQITIDVDVDWGALTTRDYINTGSEGALLDEFMLDNDYLAEGTVGERKIYLRGLTGINTRIKLAHAQLSTDFKILSMRMGYEPKRIRTSRLTGRGG